MFAYLTLKTIYRSYPALASIPVLRHKLFNHLSGEGRLDSVALTFDDGPDPVSTPLILERLDHLGIKATFFMLGSMAETYPYIAKQVADQGHEIALHGQWHKSHFFRSARTIAYDMKRSLSVVSETTGKRPTYFRPPYGVLTQPTLSACNSLLLTPVLWGAWGRDWRRKADENTVLVDIKKSFRPGMTVLLHDSDCTSYPGSFQSTLKALPGLVNLCERQGLSLGPLSTHGF